MLNVVELSATETLLVAATNEYQTSGLLPPPLPHGFVIAVYVALIKVPDVLVQLAPCVMLIADAQASLEGCANELFDEKNTSPKEKRTG